MLLRAPRTPAHDGALVGEAVRRRVIAHARRDDARDLRGHVRTEHGDVTRLGLDEAEHVGGGRRAEAALDHLGELEDRRRHEPVAEERETIEHGARRAHAGSRPPRGGGRACPREADARASAAGRGPRANESHARARPSNPVREPPVARSRSERAGDAGPAEAEMRRDRHGGGARRQNDAGARGRMRGPAEPSAGDTRRHRAARIATTNETSATVPEVWAESRSSSEQALPPWQGFDNVLTPATVPMSAPTPPTPSATHPSVRCERARVGRCSGVRLRRLGRRAFAGARAHGSLRSVLHLRHADVLNLVALRHTDERCRGLLSARLEREAALSDLCRKDGAALGLPDLAVLDEDVGERDLLRVVDDDLR